MSEFLKKLFVGNLPWSLDDNGLRGLFSKYPSVVSTVVILDKQTRRSRGFGFVEFSDDAEADSAISEMNQSEQDGRKIVINEAKPRQD